MTKQLQYKEKQLDAYMLSTFYYHFLHAPSTENTHTDSDEGETERLDMLWWKYLHIRLDNKWTAALSALSCNNMVSV